MLSLYYQAQVKKEECWFLVAVLRSFEHLAFDRTVDKASSTFEFFVPPANQKVFESLMDYLKTHGAITAWAQMDNRLTLPDQDI
jgi:hypothetical protein